MNNVFLFIDAPIVSLRLGKNLNGDKIEAGHDVYFECDVKSNPKASRLEWSRDGRRLSPDAANGVLMSGQSLVLQRVAKEAMGEYSCSAINSEGRGTSNGVQLKVMCKYFVATVSL